MDPLEPFLLPPDVVLTAVADLPEHIRSQVSGDGEFAITRPRARTSTRMLSRDAAELLEEFRTAKTVVEAVISFCATKGSEPESTLEEAFPFCRTWSRRNFWCRRTRKTRPPSSPASRLDTSWMATPS